MKDESKTKRQLIAELQDLRKQNARLSVQERKLSEVAVNELNQLYDTAPIGLCLVDTDLRFVRINEKLAEINGKPVSEHLGRTVKEVIPEIASDIEPIYRRVIDSGEPELNLHVHGTTSAEPEVEKDWLVNYYPLKSEDGTISGVNTVVQDITHLKQAEEALKASEAQYRDLVDNSLVGIYKTTIDGDILYANQALSRIFDFESPGEMSSEAVTFRYKRIQEREALIKKLKGSGRITGFELEVVTKTGKTKVVLLSAVLSGDTISGMIVDITERKQAEIALQEKEEELKRQAQGLEETNTALKVLLDHREEEKQRVGENVLANVQKLISPFIEKLENTKLEDRSRMYVNIIKSNLEDVAAPFANDLAAQYMALTPTEIQVAGLIRQGRTSKEIASLLNVSTNAISFHRANIRKKLGLSSKRANLRSYLQALAE